MSSNNQPPFYVGQKVVALKTLKWNPELGVPFAFKKGEEFTVIDIKPNNECKCKDEPFLIDIGKNAHVTGDWYCDDCNATLNTKAGDIVYFGCSLFAPINPYQSDLTRELAEQALSVGDSVDQPVKKLVNN